MNNKLNQQYFKTKNLHKKNYRKRKLTTKQKLINICIVAIIIMMYNLVAKKCENKIQKNITNNAFKTK